MIESDEITDIHNCVLKLLLNAVKIATQLMEAGTTRFHKSNTLFFFSEEEREPMLEILDEEHSSFR